MSEQAPRKVTHLTVAGSLPPRTLTPLSPIDLRPFDDVAVATADEIRQAVDDSRTAQRHWQRETFDFRVAALKRAARAMLLGRGELIELAKGELGKVEAEGLMNEALGPLETVNGWAGVIGKAGLKRRVRLNPLSFPRKQAEVELLPRGVIGVIAAWNYPVAGLYRSTIPALLAGNGVVVKPSEYTPRTSAWYLQKLRAQLPEGLLQIVQGPGEVGSALIDEGIDACVFTGSTTSGRKVRMRCAERGIPSSIEMGGKDGAIVLADCDLTRTVAGVTHWALSNVGQACGAIEVLYADERIADALVARLAKAWRKLRLGVGREAEIGPLGNARQLELVRSQVAEAMSLGAKLVCGGPAAPTPGGGLWFAPTILDGCTDQMSVVQEETFGPVLAVVRVAGADDAIRRINAGRYGLTASIWSSDLARARRLASRLEVGVVTINNHAFSGAVPALPWSGTRETGFGVANGREALSTFLRPRALVTDASSAFEPFWMPYDDALWQLGNLVADAQVGKIAWAWKLPLLLRQRARTVRRFFED